MTKKLTFILLPLLMLGCSTSMTEKFKMGSVSFSNSSSSPIWVSEIQSDGTALNIPCGILGSGSSKTAGMFPSPFPETFTINYEKNDTTYSVDIPASEARAVIEAAEPAEEITLHFVYTDQEKFILKLHFDRQGNSLLQEGELWPDDTNPLFAEYKKLLRSAYMGDAEQIKQLLAAGVPYSWENDPISLTPLEWSVRWENLEAFKVLMAQIPDNYPAYHYANCIKLAVQDDKLEFLKILLNSPHAKELSASSLQKIFYTACYHAKEPITLRALIFTYEVDIDFKVSDIGHTLLFVAVQADNVELARWLISQGANKEVTLTESGLQLRDCARSEEMKFLLQ